jgi:DNA polymerase III delta prime subunit
MIFKRKDEGKAKKSTTPDNGDFAAAVQWRCAILGIAADPDRLLPPDLVRLADYRIVVPPFDGSAVAAVIEAMTGRHPGPVDNDLARRVTLEALTIAVRSDLGAKRSLARLICLLDKKDQSAEPTPLLSELHGLGAAKDWGLALAHDLTDYAAGRLSWAAVDKGCLLTGLPGTGKTSFARALAREAGVNFIATSYSQWQAYREGHLGHVTQAIRNVFAEAQKQAPAILFIDEIDTVPARGSGKWNDDWWVSITNTLLECLDGFERREGVVVIAACNDPSRLDPALVRAGRLDRHIHIPLPDVPGLIGIFRTHLGADLEGADLRAAALSARGHTSADVERWVRDASRKARIAARPLTSQDLLDAVRSGEPEWPAEVRRLVAYHEAAHALVMVFLGIAEPKALSIGGNGGLAESGPGEMRSLTRAHLEKYLIILLAGRASEQLIFGEGTAGAGGSEDSDLSRATKLATQLEVTYGLGSYGLVCVSGETTRDLLLFEHLRSAVGRTLDRAYTAALELLSNNRSALDTLADALFTSGYLDRDEIEAILTKAPLHRDDDKTETPTASVQQPDAEPGMPEIAPATAPDSAIPASEVAGLPSS